MAIFKSHFCGLFCQGKPRASRSGISRLRDTFPNARKCPICRNLGFRDLATCPQRPRKPHMSKSGISRLGDTSAKANKTPCVEIWDFATWGHVPNDQETETPHMSKSGISRLGDTSAKAKKNPMCRNLGFRDVGARPQMPRRSQILGTLGSLQKKSKKIQEKFGRVAN